MGRLLGVICAVVLHVGFIVFGGIFFLKQEEDHGTLQKVELLSEAEAEKEKPKDSETKPKEDELEAQTEEAPDVAEVMRNLELTAAASAPALDAVSLSAIEDALNGGRGGGGDFAQALDFASGGRIGGMARGTLGEQVDSAIAIGDIDQQAHAIVQSSPAYPSEMRGKKVEGVVSLIFIVDANGKVISPRVEKSSHKAFEKPALDAIKQWKFDPALKGGQRVSSRAHQSIRFQAN